MKIGGFQKFSLLDYPGQLAAIVFTQGCNFRCPYCHNPELVEPERYTETIPEESVLAFLRGRIGKLGAVVITGGEPTLHANLPEFVRRIKELGFLVKMDSNGSNPEVIERLVSENLVDYWAMDIKAPWHLYLLITQSDVPASSLQKSMDAIRRSGKEYEFRTTFFDSLLTWEDIEGIQEALKPGDRFYLQQCRYEKTLADLSLPNYEGGEHLHLDELPQCQHLLNWADKHDIKVRLRTL